MPRCPAPRARGTTRGPAAAGGGEVAGRERRLGTTRLPRAAGRPAGGSAPRAAHLRGRRLIEWEPQVSEYVLLALQLLLSHREC